MSLHALGDAVVQRGTAELLPGLEAVAALHILLGQRQSTNRSEFRNATIARRRPLPGPRGHETDAVYAKDQRVECEFFILPSTYTR
jgi:hypothetical protein